MIINAYEFSQALKGLSVSLWLTWLNWWRRELSWTRWIGNFDNEPVMLIKTLTSRLGCHVDVHKFLKGDRWGCFHTHPAYALRICFSGGYIEEVYLSTHARFYRVIMPGHIELIRPRYCHRVVECLNGVGSWSLWLRGPVIAPIILRGEGWPAERRDRAVDSATTI